MASSFGTTHPQIHFALDKTALANANILKLQKRNHVLKPHGHASEAFGYLPWPRNLVQHKLVLRVSFGQHVMCGRGCNLYNSASQHVWHTNGS